jgi:hypothetical protein
MTGNLFVYKLRSVVTIVSCRSLRWAGYLAAAGRWRQCVWKSYSSSLCLKCPREMVKRHLFGCVGSVSLELSSGRLVPDCCAIGLGSFLLTYSLHVAESFLRT